MPRLTVIQFGDSMGVGAVVQQQGFWIPTRTYTLIVDEEHDVFNKWVCLETGDALYCGGRGSSINDFYKAQYAINYCGGVK